jgi:hypothetical protein
VELSKKLSVTLWLKKIKDKSKKAKVESQKEKSINRKVLKGLSKGHKEKKGRRGEWETGRGGDCGEQGSNSAKRKSKN